MYFLKLQVESLLQIVEPISIKPSMRFCQEVEALWIRFIASKPQKQVSYHFVYQLLCRASVHFFHRLSILCVWFSTPHFPCYKMLFMKTLKFSCFRRFLSRIFHSWALTSRTLLLASAFWHCRIPIRHFFSQSRRLLTKFF